MASLLRNSTTAHSLNLQSKPPRSFAPNEYATTDIPKLEYAQYTRHPWDGGMVITTPSSSDTEEEGRN
jgi:hypothetical protein